MLVLPTGKRERNRPRGGSLALRRIFAVALGAIALAGCSISMPLPSFLDNDPTGSIKPKTATLASAYDSRDWRVAEPVLAASLRAPGQEAPAVWSNPETGDHGEFVPVAGTFARDGQSCRAFVAQLVEGEDSKTLQAVGCPRDSGEVAVYDASPWTGL
ncbi:MAG: RT0821/Lpp0805 family surface protein [Roseiarcus sp.]